MTTHQYPEETRYMGYEQRVAEGLMKPLAPAAEKAEAAAYAALGCVKRPPVCRCGKTVLTPGITCPRAC